MEEQKLQLLCYVRNEVSKYHSDKKKEIVDKLDELIYTELNKSDTPTKTEDDDTPF